MATRRGTPIWITLGLTATILVAYGWWASSPPSYPIPGLATERTKITWHDWSRQGYLDGHIGTDAQERLRMRLRAEGFQEKEGGIVLQKKFVRFPVIHQLSIVLLPEGLITPLSHTDTDVAVSTQSYLVFRTPRPF